MRQVQTVLGGISPGQLGKTMMHEHLTIGIPGWDTDTAHPGPDYREMLAICIDKVEELKSCGVTSFVDPCPADLARDPRLAVEVAQKTGMQIVMATGLFSEAWGNPTYWRTKAQMAAAMGQDAAPYMAEMFVKEIEEGIGDTGVKAGIIKVATDHVGVTDYERVVMRAAAIASRQTGVPITTHTQQGELGLEQQAILTEAGADPAQLVIGHSDGSPDHAYHMAVIEGGSYLGFDRWGYQLGDYGRPDADKVESLLRILRAGGGQKVVVSCDHVCCYRGSNWPLDRPMFTDQESYSIMHFMRTIAPMLRAAGLGEGEIDDLVTHNPRRYFGG